MSSDPSSSPRALGGGSPEQLGIAAVEGAGVSDTGPHPAISGAQDADLARERRVGGVYAFTAYVLWGILPLYFLLLAPTGPFELVAWRILLSLAFCVILLAVTRSWSRLGRVFRQPKLVALTVLAGGLIYVNWQVFILGALTGHVIETSLGYFINPIATVLLAVLVLHERLRPTQWVALGMAAAAVLVIIIGYGSFPWIALTLTASFSLYGLVKKRLGPSVDAVSGLTLESLWLVPIAAVILTVVGTTTGLTMGTEGTQHTVLLILVGAVTAVPLLLFAAAARRASLTMIGILQFVAPILQFTIGAWVLQEPMPLERWIGFGLVWAALIVLTADSLIHARRVRLAATSG